MTPKDKAKDLVRKYVHLAKQSTGPIGTIYNAKKCALIAVDEILYVLYVLNEIDNTEQWNLSWFYNQVKQEIELL